MTFVVNGAEWDFTGQSSALAEQTIERVLEFISDSADRNQDVMIGDDFQTRPMLGALTLWELFSSDAPIDLPGELSQELASWLNCAPCYADVEEWPDGMEDSQIAIGNGQPNSNEDLAWVHYHLIANVPMAVLSIKRSQTLDTTSAHGCVPVNFVSDDEARKQFWRTAIPISGDNLNSLLFYADRAYPDLYFVDGSIEGANHLDGGYLASRKLLQNALATLNDHGSWVFNTPPPMLTPQEAQIEGATGQPSNQLIEQRFRGFNCNSAPEKPNVRLNRTCREAREVVVNQRTLYCEWHIKMQGHRNRIHFHAPVSESGHKVVIGVIHEHLP